MLQYIFSGLQGNCFLLSCEFINYQAGFMHYQVSGQSCFTNNATWWFSFVGETFKYERLILQGNNTEGGQLILIEFKICYHFSNCWLISCFQS